MSNIIALGPCSYDEKPEKEDLNGAVILEENNQIRQNYVFKDEIKIGDQTIFTIPVENQFLDENDKPKRKSRWGDKDKTRKVVHKDITFNPLQDMIEAEKTLAITYGQGSGEEQNGTVNDQIKQIENKKKSKWATDIEKLFNPPPLHSIANGVSIDDLEYLLRLYRLDELNQKIQNQDFMNKDPDLRSPSPDPVYDPKTGQRINTRENRAKDNIMREKNDLIEDCINLKSEYFVAPSDYKPLKKQKKIFLPGDDPENNYMGMIIGPRGSTQKTLEQKCGCKISIRGKGSSRNKKSALDSDEKLHILIQADTDEQIEQGSQLIEQVLRGESAEINDLKKTQMWQLQVLTGAIRDDFCENCHEKGHRIWACPNKMTWKKAEVKCEICGDKSHPTGDCPQKREYLEKLQQQKQEEQRILEKEYGPLYSLGIQTTANILNQNQQKIQQTQAKSSSSTETEFFKFLRELEGDKALDLLALAGKQHPLDVLKQKQEDLKLRREDLINKKMKVQEERLQRKMKKLQERKGRQLFEVEKQQLQQLTTQQQIQRPANIIQRVSFLTDENRTYLAIKDTPSAMEQLNQLQQQQSQSSQMRAQPINVGDVSSDEDLNTKELDKQITMIDHETTNLVEEIQNMEKEEQEMKQRDKKNVAQSTTFCQANDVKTSISTVDSKILLQNQQQQQIQLQQQQLYQQSMLLQPPLTNPLLQQPRILPQTPYHSIGFTYSNLQPQYGLSNQMIGVNPQNMPQQMMNPYYSGQQFPPGGQFLQPFPMQPTQANNLFQPNPYQHNK